MVRDFVEGILNGLKRAVLFVVDVLLFIPRLIVGGIVGFLVKEVKAAAIEEDEVEEEPDEEEDEDEEEPDEEEDEDEEEPDEEEDDKLSQFFKRSLPKPNLEVPIAVSLATADAAAAVSPEEKSYEEDTKDDSEEESPSSEKKNITKKSKTSPKPEKVEGEVIEIFGKSDMKAAQYETAFMNAFNNASSKYSKDQWMDGAIELQKFARAFLDALSIKEGVTPLKGKDVTVDKKYNDLLDKLDAKIKFTEDEKKKLQICLGCQSRTSEPAVKPQMEVAFKLINTYQNHYYEAWMQMQKNC